jgi:hypothetical protein
MLLKMVKQRVSVLQSGLCATFFYMRKRDIISSTEYWILYNLIKTNKPLKTYDLSFYFEPYRTEPRLEYLDHLILLNSPNFFIRLYYHFKFRKIYSYKYYGIH